MMDAVPKKTLLLLPEAIRLRMKLSANNLS
jgi:hypothetical protein